MVMQKRHAVPSTIIKDHLREDGNAKEEAATYGVEASPLALTHPEDV
jgi:hypothetical protein